MLVFWMAVSVTNGVSMVFSVSARLFVVAICGLCCFVWY